MSEHRRSGPSIPGGQRAGSLDWSITLGGAGRAFGADHNHSAGHATLKWPLSPDQPLAVGPFWARIDAPHAPAAVRSERGLLLLLKGTLYGHSPGDVLDLYGQYGEAFARHLEGSFALALLDLRAGQVWAVTDRVGSHRIYALHEKDVLTVSSTLNRPEFTHQPLSVQGLACALANGNMLGNLTPYHGVRSLERASVHDLRPESVQSRTYWQFTFGPPSRHSAAELQAELAHLLRAAVRRRLHGAGPDIYLSLSGGYDSRGLLALLAETGREFRTFSYALGEAGAAHQRRSDADAARQLARQYGVSHVTLPSYDGHLLQTLRRNARWGQGMANFSDEADAWAALGDHHPSDLFTGEQIFGHQDHPATSTGELLQRARVSDIDALSGVQGTLGGDTSQLLQAAYASEVRALLDRMPGGLSASQQEVWLYLDQRESHRLMPWREQFAGRLAPVHLPYLDRQILDFLQTLPAPLFRSKTLFHQTLRSIDPGVSQIALPRHMGYVPDWRGELVRQRGPLLDRLSSRASRLDGLIPPEVVRTLLEHLTVPGKALSGTAAVRQTLGTLRRTRTANTVLGPLPLRVRPVDPTTFLLRVLTLRELLVVKELP